MLKVTIIVKQYIPEEEKSWEEIFTNVWEGPFEISTRTDYKKEYSSDLIIIDFSKWGLEYKDFFNSIAKEIEGKSFLIIAAHKDVDLAIDALKFGAIGFLLKPIKRAELLSSLARLNTTKSKTEDQPFEYKGKVITLSSYKGGTGLSTITVNLAYTLSTIYNKKTLIIDAAAYSNHISLLLNVIPRNNVADICQQGKNLDSEFFKNAVKVASNNLGIIGGLSSKGELNEINIPTLRFMTETAKSIYDYILIDTAPRVLDEMNLHFLRHSDYLLIFTTLDILSIKDCNFYAENLKEIGIPEDRIKLIINRVDSFKGDIDPDMLQKKIRKDIFHTIVNDYDLCFRSIIEARPFIGIAPSSKLSKSIISLVEKITKLNEPIDKTSDVEEQKSKKSLFHWLSSISKANK